MQGRDMGAMDWCRRDVVRRDVVRRDVVMKPVALTLRQTNIFGLAAP